MSGYRGKVLLVDLTSGKVEERQIEDRLYRDFIGGVGLAVRLLYELQPGKVDPLGRQNVLGFMPGLLSGTTVPGSSRLTVVAKSPLTGSWGDANVGGSIASEIKRAGYDGILFRGRSPHPVYLLIYQGKAELRDASHLWGKDTIETQERIRNEVGEPRLSILCIGPAGEVQSLISAIITEQGRAAARSGLGAVMGSKHLKAIAVRGQNPAPVADGERVRQLRRQFVKAVNETKVPFVRVLTTRGTVGSLHALVAEGATPIKNWSLIGLEACPSYELFADRVNAYLTRRSSCSTCPIGCGAILKPEELGMGECMRPEYETAAAFGPMCLNSDIVSLIEASNLCNRYGLDTISVGNVVAFAMECYERGIITKEDTDGLELTWGNGPAMVVMVGKIAEREGIGAMLADGVRRAADRIGRGSEEWAIHVGGQEPGYHDPRLVPARGTGYICDPTPGRHTVFLVGKVLETAGSPGPYPELWPAKVGLREYGRKAAMYGNAVKYEQVFSSAGLCKFLLFTGGYYPMIDFVAAATGWNLTAAKVLMIGERIQTMRQLFNIREGIDPRQFQLPARIKQPATMGPFKNIHVDFDLLRKQYYEAMGWDEKTGYPIKSRLYELGLGEFASVLSES